MVNYPMNIWVINENEFDEFTFTGGKVVYIVEEPNPRFTTHPAIVTAGALLPPVDSIRAELDGSMFEAVSIYESYLNGPEADPYISTLVAAAIKQIPIGIMFGKDELNMQFPKMLINYLYQYYGLALGIRGKIQPYIEIQMLPFDLAKLYCLNIIDYPTFMEKHPDLPIHPMVISKMAIDVNPVVIDKDMNSYIEYFEKARKAISNNGGKFLIDPMEGL